MVEFGRYFVQFTVWLKSPAACHLVRMKEAAVSRVNLYAFVLPFIPLYFLAGVESRIHSQRMPTHMHTTSKNSTG